MARAPVSKIENGRVFWSAPVVSRMKNQGFSRLSY
jgi:hypothetical protein